MLEAGHRAQTAGRPRLSSPGIPERTHRARHRYFRASTPRRPPSSAADPETAGPPPARECSRAGRGVTVLRPLPGSALDAAIAVVDAPTQSRWLVRPVW